VLIVLRPGGETALGLGHLAAVTAAVTSSLGAVVVRKIGAEERSVVLLLYPMVANFVVLGCALPFVYRPMPLDHLGLLALVAVLGLVAMRLVIAAYRQAEAVIVAPMQYSQILWAAVFGALIFDETPDRYTVIGAGVIIASGVYIVLREGRGSVSQNRPVLEAHVRVETPAAPRPGPLARLRGGGAPG